ncbi:MAG: phage major capsid protein [Acidobacteria bacterium]|nr:phage major capsid protein [Acidobacteriota bacterium]
MQRLGELTGSLEAAQRRSAFVEYCRAVALAGADGAPMEILEGRLDARSLARVEKAAVAAMTGTTHSALGMADLGTEWLLDLERETVLGALKRAGALPGPFDLPGTPVVTANASAGWVGQGSAIPAANLTVSTAALAPTKLARILGISRELVRATDPRGLAMLDRQLRVAVKKAEDAALLGNAAAVANVNPAGLLAGLSGVSAGGPDPDIGSLVDAVRGGDPESPVFVCSAAGAAYLGTFAGFKDVSVAPTGGRLLGAPQVVSAACGSRLICIDAASLVVADGGVGVEQAGAASVRMDDAPAAGALTSAFQSNLALIRIVRLVHWILGHSDGAAFIDLPVGGSPAGSPA